MAKGERSNDKLSSTIKKTKVCNMKPPPPKETKQNGDELRCFPKLNSFCSTKVTRCVVVATNQMTSLKRGKKDGHCYHDKRVCFIQSNGVLNDAVIVFKSFLNKCLVM